MSLVSLDDSFYDHPKAMEAGEEAADVFVRGLAYCRRYNTKGKIPKSALLAVTRRRSALKCADALVRVVLWHDNGDHWLVHDYETWYANDAETKLAKSRKLAASRAKHYRDTKRVVSGTDTANDTATSPLRDESHDASRDANVMSPRTLPRARTGASPYSDTDSNPLSGLPVGEEESERASTIEVLGGIAGDVAAATMAEASDGIVDGSASATQLVTLQRIARSAKPKTLTRDDFGLIGEAVREGKAGTWRKQRRITIGWLIADGGKVLFDLLAEAREWAASLAEAG